MSDLTRREISKLEKLLDMGGGYVLDFSNRTFAEFVEDTTGRDIYDDKYDYASGSKANRLRAFWTTEPNHVVGRLLKDLIEHRDDELATSAAGDDQHAALRDQCLRIVKRLMDAAPVQDIEVLTPNAAGNDFELLAKQVRDAIENNEPEAGLDRLHTFVVKYIRVLCGQRGIAADRDRPLHALFGGYVKALVQAGLVRSPMAERILKSSISILDAFNEVRNERSFAHDNPILGYDEALLIYNNIASVVRYVRAIEAVSAARTTPAPAEDEFDDIPF